MIRIDVTPDAAGVSRQIRRSLGELDRSLTRAKRRAVNKTARWVRTRAIREIAAANNIPQKILRGHRNPVSGKKTRGRRGRVFVSRAVEGHEHASLWIGTRAVAAGYLGTPHQFRYGAKVRGRKFEKAFVATMASGHVGIFRRAKDGDGRVGRLPIKEEYVELAQADTAVAGIRRQIPARLRKTLDQELNYELNVRGAARR